MYKILMNQLHFQYSDLQLVFNDGFIFLQDLVFFFFKLAKLIFSWMVFFFMVDVFVLNRYHICVFVAAP